MSTSTEQLEQLSEMARRCDAAGNDAVLAGLVAASAILLPPSKWKAFTEATHLDRERLSALVAIVPKETHTETSNLILEA